MRYIDSGRRDPASAVGSWFQSIVQAGDVSAIRWQTGFFSADGLGHLAPTLDSLRRTGGTVTALIGSNNGDTLASDIDRLITLMGIPRPNAHLGVISFSGAFFHPKVYHFTRQDGAQAAYVGSANLTSAGIGSLHVEAGVLLDTRAGDGLSQLQQIADAIDQWFAVPNISGLSIVGGSQTVVQLLASGVLAAQPTPRAQNQSGAAAGTGTIRPRLQQLVAVPSWGVSSGTSGSALAAPLTTRGTGSAGNLQMPRPSSAIPRAFMMTLQRTDVGVGQTTRGTSRRSPEIFVPLAARDEEPGFWGWPTDFTADANWAGPIDRHGFGKMDRPGVMVRLGGATIPVHIWYNPDKKDLRLRSEHLRSAGSVGDILYVERVNGSSGFHYYVDVVPTGSLRHAILLGQCTHSVRNSLKRFGYV